MNYTVAFNKDTRVATILLPGHQPPEGSEEIGILNATAVSPNPTDASTQHITTMLQRHGIDTDQGITVVREPVTEVIEQEGLPSTEANGAALTDATFPTSLDLGVGDKHDLVKGTTKDMKFASSDEETAKVGRGGNVTALKAGTATITVTNKDGSSNDVVITVREPVSPSFAGTGAGAGSDAREAAAA